MERASGVGGLNTQKERYKEKKKSVQRNCATEHDIQRRIGAGSAFGEKKRSGGGGLIT